MKSQETVKTYLVVGIIQVIVVALFGVATIFLLGIEDVILTPLPYLVALWAMITALDAVILLLYLRKQSQEAAQPLIEGSTYEQNQYPNNNQVTSTQEPIHSGNSADYRG